MKIEKKKEIIEIQEEVRISQDDHELILEKGDKIQILETYYSEEDAIDAVENLLNVCRSIGEPRYLEICENVNSFDYKQRSYFFSSANHIIDFFREKPVAARGRNFPPETIIPLLKQVRDIILKKYGRGFDMESELMLYRTKKQKSKIGAFAYACFLFINFFESGGKFDDSFDDVVGKKLWRDR